jgi:hypothetical protein
MQNTSTTSKDPFERFWDQFVDRALKIGSRGSALPWMVRRAEAYLQAFPGKRLSQHTREDVHSYLEQVGRLDRIQGWQFVQIVDALEILLAIAKAPVAEEVDWGYWRASAQSLSPDHPTIVREESGGQRPLSDPVPVSGARYKAKRNAVSELDAVRAAHGEILERLLAEIRLRRYSIRTEQAYEAWVCRFILFCGNRDPLDAGAGSIRGFLEDLLVRGNDGRDWCEANSRLFNEDLVS